MSDDGQRKDDELPKRLSNLPRARGGDRAPAAMCYRMAAPPTTTDFVCRHCGQRTTYPFRTPLPDLDFLASLLPKLPGWSFSLEDREFCRSCTPHLKLRKPTVVLVARPEGATGERRTRGITRQDLEALGTTAAPADWVARLRWRYRLWKMLGRR